MNDQELIQQLDELGRQERAAPAYLASRIVANLPPQNLLEQLFAWFSQALWRSATAVAMPLTLGFFVGISDVTNSEFDDTQWYDSQYLVYADVLADVVEEYSYDEF